MNFTKEYKIGVYARVSTGSEIQKKSNEHQISYFDEYLKQRGLKAFEYYVDEAQSGRSIKKRLAFQRMIRDAENGIINCIISTSITRFARNQRDTHNIISKLKEKGVRFIFIDQNIDTDTEEGMKNLGLWAWVSEIESRQISERRKRGGIESQKEGRFISNKPPLGYKSENKKLIIDESEAPIVRRIFELYLNGYGCQKIATILNKEGIKTRKGEAFAKTKIQYILKNPAYKGWIVGNKYVTIDFSTKKRKINDESNWVITKNAHEPIIDEKTFDKVQSIMSGKEFKMPKKSPHIFTGIIKCKNCNHSMMFKQTKKENNKIYRYYVCTTRTNKSYGLCNVPSFREDLLKEIVDIHLKTIKANKSQIEKIIQQGKEELELRLNESNREIEEIENLIEKNNSQREELTIQLINKIIKPDMYKKMDDMLSEELSNLIRRKERVHNSKNAIQIYERNCKLFVDKINNYNNIDNMTNLDLKDLIDCIYIDENHNVEVILKVHISETIFEEESCNIGQIVTTVYPKQQLNDVIYHKEIYIDKTKNIDFILDNYKNPSIIIVSKQKKIV